MAKKPTNTRVPFRLIQTPCCHTLLCYVNPRLPNYCSECGERIYAKLKTGEGILVSSPAWLRIDDENAKVEDPTLERDLFGIIINFHNGDESE